MHMFVYLLRVYRVSWYSPSVYVCMYVCVWMCVWCVCLCALCVSVHSLPLQYFGVILGSYAMDIAWLTLNADVKGHFRTEDLNFETGVVTFAFAMSILNLFVKVCTCIYIYIKINTNKLIPPQPLLCLYMPYFSYLSQYFYSKWVTTKDKNQYPLQIRRKMKSKMQHMTCRPLFKQMRSILLRLPQVAHINDKHIHTYKHTYTHQRQTHTYIHTNTHTHTSHTYIHTNTHTHINDKHIHTYIQTHIHTSTTNTYIHTYKHTHTHINDKHIHTYIQTHTHTPTTNTYIHTYIHTYTHTYIHTT